MRKHILLVKQLPTKGDFTLRWLFCGNTYKKRYSIANGIVIDDVDTDSVETFLSHFVDVENLKIFV